jgi:hypothetical protein
MFDNVVYGHIPKEQKEMGRNQLDSNKLKMFFCGML